MNHPLSKILTSMSDIEVRTGARVLIGVGDGSGFPSAAHLAACAGFAPVTRSSSSSIRGEQLSRNESKQLEQVFFLSASAVLADPTLRTYYDKKIGQGKHHIQALLRLAGRRADVLFALLRDGTFHKPRLATTTT
ncbi:transposase [Streptomyces sp. P9-A2]